MCEKVVIIMEWYKELIKQYQLGLSNVFMLTGNISDYVVENKMLKEFLQNEFLEKFQNVIVYNMAMQGRDIVAEKERVDSQDSEYDWDEILSMLRNTSHERYCVIIEYPEFFLSSNSPGGIDESLKKRLIQLNELLTNHSFYTSEHMVLFVSESKSALHPMLLSSNSRINIINVAFPNEQERLEMIQYLINVNNPTFEMDLTIEQFARITAGLSRLHIEDIFLIAEGEGLLNKDVIMSRKKELIERQFGELIEMVDTDRLTLEDFSGQEHLKMYHMEAIVEPILNGDTSAVPKGIMYTGAPGTGKTYFANCLAGSAKINFIEFKMSKILDKWVGQAERNLEKAFNCFNSLAPVIVFIDELDQALSRGGANESNSVKSNMFGMFLSFLSKPENRGRILFIGATNYPNNIDEALKRAGRFDKKIPFMLPEKSERVTMLDYHIKKSKLNSSVTKEFLDVIADKTMGYTPAEIENIIVKTVELFKRRRLNIVTNELIEESMKFIRAAKNPKIEEMTDLALKECNDLEFIPEVYMERYLELIQNA